MAVADDASPPPPPPPLPKLPVVDKGLGSELEFECGGLVVVEGKNVTFSAAAAAAAVDDDPTPPPAASAPNGIIEDMIMSLQLLVVGPAAIEPASIT